MRYRRNWWGARRIAEPDVLGPDVLPEVSAPDTDELPPTPEGNDTMTPTPNPKPVTRLAAHLRRAAGGCGRAARSIVYGAVVIVAILLLGAIGCASETGVSDADRAEFDRAVAGEAIEIAGDAVDDLDPEISTTTRPPRTTTTVEVPSTTSTLPPTTSLPRTPPAQPLDVSALFVPFIRAEYPALDVIDDQTLIDAAREVCARLDAGEPFTSVVWDIAEQTTAQGLSDDQVAAVGGMVGAGVEAFCPHQSWQVGT